MGSPLVAVLDGLSRYAAINELRRDEVCPELLGFGRIVSEESVRNGLRQVVEHPDEWEAWLRGLQDRLVIPLLADNPVGRRNNLKGLNMHPKSFVVA